MRITISFNDNNELVIADPVYPEAHAARIERHRVDQP